MPIQQPIKDFLGYLSKNPSIRMQIAAAPGKTLLYAGAFFKPIWKELADLKRTNPQLATKEILPDVLARGRIKGTFYFNLLGAKKGDILLYFVAVRAKFL